MPTSHTEKIREHSYFFIYSQTENCKGREKAVFIFVFCIRDVVGGISFPSSFFIEKPQKKNQPAISRIINLFIKILQKTDQWNLDRYQCLAADVTYWQRLRKRKGKKIKGKEKIFTKSNSVAQWGQLSFGCLWRRQRRISFAEGWPWVL